MKERPRCWQCGRLKATPGPSLCARCTGKAKAKNLPPGRGVEAAKALTPWERTLATVRGNKTKGFKERHARQDR